VVGGDARTSRRGSFLPVLHRLRECHIKVEVTSVAARAGWLHQIWLVVRRPASSVLRVGRGR